MIVLTVADGAGDGVVAVNDRLAVAVGNSLYYFAGSDFICGYCVRKCGDGCSCRIFYCCRERFTCNYSGCEFDGQLYAVGNICSSTL